MHHKFTVIGRQVKVVSHMWDDTVVEKSLDFSFESELKKKYH